MLLSEEMLLATALIFYFLLQNTFAVSFSADKSAVSYQASVSNKHKYFHGSGPKTSFMAIQHEKTSATFFFFLVLYNISCAIVLNDE